MQDVHSSTAAALVSLLAILGCSSRDEAQDEKDAGHMTLPDAAGEAPISISGPRPINFLPGFVYIGDWDFSRDRLAFESSPCDAAKGTGNRRLSVGFFALSEYPIVNGTYAYCVAAGRCTPPEPDAADPDIRSWDDPERQYVPALVSHRQAAAFCEAAGMRLPTWVELVRAAQADAEIPGVATLTQAAIDCYAMGAGDPMVCAQLARMNHEANPRPQLYRVGAVSLDRTGAYDLFGSVDEWTRSYASSEDLCSLAEGSADFDTFDPNATRHISVSFATEVIQSIVTGRTFRGRHLLDDAESGYPKGFRCASEP